MAAQCFFCKGASESPALDRGFSCCRKCGKEKLLPYLRQVLGAEALVGALNETGTGPGSRPSMAMMNLTAAAEKVRAESRRRGKPLRGAALELSLAETAVQQELKTLAASRGGRSAGQVTKESITEAVRKAGLRTSAPATTSLSTNGGGVLPRGPRRPQPAGQVTKESIAEAVRRAGLRTA